MDIPLPICFSEEDNNQIPALFDQAIEEECMDIPTDKRHPDQRYPDKRHPADKIWSKEEDESVPRNTEEHRSKDNAQKFSYPGILLACPVSASSYELSLSTLRCIKTWLRNCVSQERLNHNIVATVHR